MSSIKSAGRKAQAGNHSGTTRGKRPTWELMGIVLGSDAKDAATAGNDPGCASTGTQWHCPTQWAHFTITMAKQSYKPLTSKSFRSASKVGKAGRKRHGSHRSAIIGKYHFTVSSVM